MAQKKVLFIVAQDGFRDEEFFIPAEILENNGIHVTVASIKPGTCHGSLSGSVNAGIAVREARADDYDCIALAGGPGARALKDHPEVIALIRDAEKKEKLIAAICIAPTILAEAGVLRGKRATVWNSSDEPGRFIESKGAICTGKDIEADGGIITANGPVSAGLFGNAVVEALSRG